MAEYIKRDALIDKLLSHAFTDDLYGMGLSRGLEIAVAEAKRMPYREIPAADVAPVVHGEWVEKTDSIMETYYVCSACDEAFYLIEGTPTENLYNFCPNCGADMRERKGDDAAD